jgi:signal transduction histidine kinase
MVPRQLYTRLHDEPGEAGEKGQRREDDVGRPVRTRRLEPVDDVPVLRQREPRQSQRPSAGISTEALDGFAVLSLEVSREPEVFSLTALLADVVGAFRFAAHRKQLALTLLGAHGAIDCLADMNVVRSTLVDAIGAAVTAAPAGARVSVEMARSSDRVAVDVGAPGWDPRLPPAPPAGSGVAVSVLRTASGARLVLSVPAAVQGAWFALEATSR